MAAPDFLVHEANDSVGVVVKEDVVAGKELSGWVMENDDTVTVKCLHDIPIGHKIALGDLKVGDTVIKYSHDIGKVVADVAKGGHVHVHNVKTKRW